MARASGNPVDILLSNREGLALLFALVVWILGKMGLVKKKDAARKAAAPSSASDEAARTRRVQEEVRRRIAERRAGGAPSAPRAAGNPLPPAPPLLAPRPVAGGPMKGIPGDWIGRMTGGAPSAPPPEPEEVRDVGEEDIENVLARQRKLEDQLRTLEATVNRPPAVVGPAPGWGPEAPAAVADAVADLRSPQGARRAVVLREILGVPIALRPYGFGQ